MRVGHLVVAAVGGLLLSVVCGGARPAMAEVGPAPGELEVYDAIPAEPAVRVRAGESRQFAVWVAGEGLQYQWLLDGGPVGDRHSWTFTPREIDAGAHLVTVAVDGPDGRVARTWKVQVVSGEVAPPPPTAPVSSTTPSTSASTRPTTSSTTASPATTSTSSSSTSTSTTSSSSSSTSTTTSTHVPTTSTTHRPTTTTTSSLRPSTSSTARATTTTSTTAPRPTTSTTVPRAAGVTESDVRALFERYKAAWRNHDIDGLEAVGQVATQGQMDALKSYFESVKDLEVDVTILSITTSGDEARVRFIRRDRFRDPGGSMVTKESPVIEKRVVRTPGGPRLAPLR